MGSSGEFVGESVGVHPPAPPRGLRPYNPLKTKNKNLSKKGKQEPRCAPRWSGPSRTRQKETAQNLPELVPVRRNRLPCSGRGCVGRF